MANDLSRGREALARVAGAAGRTITDLSRKVSIFTRYIALSLIYSLRNALNTTATVGESATFSRGGDSATVRVWDKDTGLKLVTGDADEAMVEGMRRTIDPTMGAVWSEGLGPNPTDLTQASWTKSNTVAEAPNRVTYVGGLGNPNTKMIQDSISGLGTADKTFLVYAVISGTGTFRFKNTHSGVLDNFSEDLIATATPTEYSFTIENDSSPGDGGQIVGIAAGTEDGAFDLTVDVLDLKQGIPTPVNDIGHIATTVADGAELGAEKFTGFGTLGEWVSLGNNRYQVTASSGVTDMDLAGIGLADKEAYTQVNVESLDGGSLRIFSGTSPTSITVAVPGPVNIEQNWGAVDTFRIRADGAGISAIVEVISVKEALPTYIPGRDPLHPQNKAGVFLDLPSRADSTDYLEGDLVVMAGAYWQQVNPGGPHTTGLASLGSELVTNGDFATDTDWTKGTGWAIGSGLLTATAAADATNAYQLVNTENGKIYEMTFTLSNKTEGGVRIQTNNNVGTTITSNGTYTERIAITNDNQTQIRFQAIGQFSGSIDNVSVKEVGLDVIRDGADVLGPDLVEDGDFAVDDGSWVKNSWTIGSGVATSTAQATSMTQADVVVIGLTYRVSFDITADDDAGSGVRMRIGGTWGTFTTGVGSYTEDIVSAGSALEIQPDVASTLSIDNVSVREVNPAMAGELVVDGSFDGDGSDWTLQTGWVVANGVASCDGTQTGNSGVIQDVGAAEGKTYKVEFDLTVVAGSLTWVACGGGIDGTNLSADGHYTYFLTGTGSEPNLSIAGDLNFIGSIDNISVKEVLPDFEAAWLYQGRYNLTGKPPFVLHEPGATNLLTDPDNPANQTTASLGTGFYTLSVHGSDSVAVAANTATVTGAGSATPDTPLTFEVTVAGTVDLTVTGAPDKFQLEAGQAATSFTLTTRAATSEKVATPCPKNAFQIRGRFIDQERVGANTMLLTNAGDNRAILFTNSAQLGADKYVDNAWAGNSAITSGVEKGKVHHFGLSFDPTAGMTVALDGTADASPFADTADLTATGDFEVALGTLLGGVFDIDIYKGSDPDWYKDTTWADPDA